MNIRTAIVNLCDWYLDKYNPVPPAPPPPTAPPPRRPAVRKATRPVKPATGVNYEAWRSGKTGDGPKVTAPGEMSKEWQARLHCEIQLNKAMRYCGMAGARKQLKAGCKRERIDTRRRHDKGSAWGEFIDIATAVINNYHDDYSGMYWEGAKEIIDDAFGNASYKIYLLGN